MVLEFVYGGVLAFTHYFNDALDKACSPYRNKIVSLGAGISLAYIFLFLFPELSGISSGSPFIFLFVLLGFSVFHVAEKHVYQHKSKNKILREIKEIHSVSFFVYHFLIGITIYFITLGGFFRGLIFFIPIFLH